MLFRSRNSMEGNQACHKLMQNLNRELFKGSILINEIQLRLQIGNHSHDIVDDTNVSDCDFVANQVALALFHYANETKIYFSLDQATINVSSTSDNFDKTTALLFSGGSSDTPLPSHLPHLVAHSMEDRFIQGVVDIRRHRSAEFLGQPAKSCKLRLVIGDVEASPSGKYIIPIFQCLRRIKASIGTFEYTSHTMDTSPTESGKKEMKVKKKEQYWDIAIRLTSIRLALTHQEQVASAIVISESSLRLLQLISQVRNRIQLDFRCANVQEIGRAHV